MADEPEVAGHYSTQYGQFAAGVHEKVRRAAFGDDVGQNSWADAGRARAVRGVAIARRRFDARAQHEPELRATEGDERFEGRQRFFDMAALLASERRLSRLAYVAEKRA